MKKISVVLLTILLIYGNCRSAKETPAPKNTYVLPDLALLGKNTMACLIDDVAWVNAGSHVEPGGWGNVAVPNLIGSLVYSIQNDTTQVQINGNMFTTSRNDDLNLTFSCIGLPKIAEVYLKGDKSTVSLSLKYVPNGGNNLRDNSNLEQFLSDPKLPNSASISFVKVDTTKRIISGVFSGKVFSSNSSQKTSKNIFQGRFDINYLPYPIIK
jgi:hypothetical protein